MHTLFGAKNKIEKWKFQIFFLPSHFFYLVTIPRYVSFIIDLPFVQIAAETFIEF